MCEPAPVDVAHQQPRLAASGYPKPAGPGDVGDRPDGIPEDGVDPAIVIQQPAVDIASGHELLGLLDYCVNRHVEYALLIQALGLDSSASSGMTE